MKCCAAANFPFIDFNVIIKEIGRGARESFTTLLNAEVSDVQLSSCVGCVACPRTLTWSANTACVAEPHTLQKLQKLGRSGYLKRNQFEYSQPNRRLVIFRVYFECTALF